MVAYGPTTRGFSLLDARKPHHMSMKHRRGNREAKKPKQNKTKIAAPTFASVVGSVKPAAPAKRK